MINFTDLNTTNSTIALSGVANDPLIVFVGSALFVALGIFVILRWTRVW